MVTVSWWQLRSVVEDGLQLLVIGCGGGNKDQHSVAVWWSATVVMVSKSGTGSTDNSQWWGWTWRSVAVVLVEVTVSGGDGGDRRWGSEERWEEHIRLFKKTNTFHGFSLGWNIEYQPVMMGIVFPWNEGLRYPQESNILRNVKTREFAWEPRIPKWIVVY